MNLAVQLCDLTCCVSALLRWKRRLTGHIIEIYRVSVHDCLVYIKALCMVACIGPVYMGAKGCRHVG